MNHRHAIIVTVGVLALAALACNFPFFGPATPEATALPPATTVYVPTLTFLAPTQLPADSATPAAPTPLFPSPTPIEIQPVFTPTVVPSPTAIPLPPTSAPTQSLVGPENRPRFSLPAFYLDDSPDIDGTLDDDAWDMDRYSIESVVYGGQNWQGPDDLSGRAMLGWDEDYLYVGVRVLDDVFVQNARDANLYKGDSLEILFDADVSSDYYSDYLSGDDYQLGLSPGGPEINENTQAWLWYPSSKEGSPAKVVVAAREREDGYLIEAAIPWSTFGVRPAEGHHYGFALSISDNDNKNQNEQQSMVSSAVTRMLTNPMTWGDLSLIH